MSLCDTCAAPGACCKRMRFWLGGDPMTQWVGNDLNEDNPQLDLPPVYPVEMVEQWISPEGRPYAEYRYGCYALQPDGRCGIYEDRPKLCRDYEPGTDPMCVHYTPPPENPPVQEKTAHD